MGDSHIRRLAALRGSSRGYFTDPSSHAPHKGQDPALAFHLDAAMPHRKAQAQDRNLSIRFAGALRCPASVDTILTLFRRGPDALRKSLRGDFVFAIVDADSGQTHLFHDAVGARARY